MIAIMRLPLALLMAILFVTACARPAMSGIQAEASRSETISTSEYKLGVGDKVRIIVYNEESLSGEFQVNAAGKIAYPLIGDVSAFDQTTEQVTDQLRSRLADGYLIDPKVSMEVVTYRPYFILGEVRTPGQYPYSNGLTVTNAIATAAGYTPRADKKTVFIRRSGAAEEKPYKLEPDLKVYPGDTIRLGERFF